MFRKRHPKVGAIPGTLVIGKDAPPPKIRIASYNENDVEQAQVSDVEELRQAFDESNVTWIDVQGFEDEAIIRRVGEIFSLHPLAIEDVVNVPHRPCADLYDQHMLLIVRSVEAEMVTGLINTYLSSIANRTNEVMKVLTIMASIFIPLTFMAGIYGMNFEAMPELKMRWAYPLLWTVMGGTAIGMLLYFWRLGWIWNRDMSADDEEE
jgi:Mg2+ and Co2+ transporter CorA